METQDRNAERGEGWGVLQDNVAQVSPQCSTISGKESHKHHWSVLSGQVSARQSGDTHTGRGGSVYIPGKWRIIL